MEVVDAIRDRRSVRHFDTLHRIPPSQERELIDLAMLSPTAFNLQNWRFVMLKDADLRHAIREHAWNQPQITDASLLVALCANLDAWKDAYQYWDQVPSDSQQIIAASIDLYYSARPVVQRDEGMRSCGLAAQNLMLAATSMGLDSCPVACFDFDAVGRLINLPSNHMLAMLVAIGKATGPSSPRGSRIRYEDIVIYDRYRPS